LDSVINEENIVLQMYFKLNHLLLTTKLYKKNDEHINKNHKTNDKLMKYIDVSTFYFIITYFIILLFYFYYYIVLLLLHHI